MEIFCQYDELKEAEEVAKLFHPQNPNRHPKSQLRAIRRVLEKNGWRLPVVVSRLSGRMTRGHGRVEAVMGLGGKVPVQYQDYEDERAELADIIADNQLSHGSHFDGRSLTDILESLDDGQFDVAAHTGFDPAALEELMTAVPDDEEEPAPLPEVVERMVHDLAGCEVEVQLGEHLKLGAHHLFCVPIADGDRSWVEHLRGRQLLIRPGIYVLASDEIAPSVIIEPDAVIAGLIATNYKHYHQ